MLIKYSKSTNVVLEVQSSPTHFITSNGADEAVETYSGSIRPIAGMIRIQKNDVRDKTQQEIDAQKPASKARLEELKQLPSPTLSDVIEALKIQGYL